MIRLIAYLTIFLALTILLPACNSSKIACPTYADSFPEKKAKKQTKPEIPKASKPKSGLLPPNAKRR